MKLDRASSVIVSVRLSGDDYLRLSTQAEERGLSVGQLIRLVVLGADTPLPPKARRRRWHITADLAEVGQLAAWVARLNGAIVQWAIREREAGHEETHGAVERLLADLRLLQTRLLAFVETLA
jgi:hypothetical protein